MMASDGLGSKKSTLLRGSGFLRRSKATTKVSKTPMSIRRKKPTIAPGGTNWLTRERDDHGETKASHLAQSAKGSSLSRRWKIAPQYSCDVGLWLFADVGMI
jgi:hypothetical protein